MSLGDYLLPWKAVPNMIRDVKDAGGKGSGHKSVVGAVGKYADPFGALLGKNVQEFMHEKIPTQVNESLSGIAKKDPMIRFDRKYGLGQKGSPLRSVSNWAQDKPGDTAAIVTGAILGGGALAGAWGGGAAGGAGGGAAGGGTAAPAQAGWTQYARLGAGGMQQQPQQQQPPPPMAQALRQEPPMEEVVVEGKREPIAPPVAPPTAAELSAQSASLRDAFEPKLSPMEIARLRTSLLRRKRNAY